MKLADADLLKLLPDHLANDPAFAAAGEALKPWLRQLSLSIPNLLVYARLGKADHADFLPPLRRLTGARPGLAPLSMEALESLAWQFHVDFREVAKTPEQLAGMILNSIPWHRIKGTPASIYAALSLCGFSGLKIEEHDPRMPWAAWQLGFEEIASIEHLKRIVEICQEMQPARCRLWRVYVRDYDFRPGVWSGALPRNAWSYAWWSSYSGDYHPDIPGLDDKGLLVSFGLKRKFQTETLFPGPWLARVWGEQERAFFIPRLSHYIWSWSKWSDVYAPRHSFVVGNLLTGHACEYIYESGPWPQKPWPEKPWQANAHWGRRWPDWRMHLSRIFKSQGVWSDASDKKPSVWSGPNCNWSAPLIFEPGEPARWSESSWSDPLNNGSWRLVAEQFYERRPVQAAAMSPAFNESAAFQTGALASRFHFRKRQIWGQTKYSERPQAPCAGSGGQLLALPLPETGAGEVPEKAWLGVGTEAAAYESAAPERAASAFAATDGRAFGMGEWLKNWPESAWPQRAWTDSAHFGRRQNDLQIAITAEES